MESPLLVIVVALIAAGIAWKVLTGLIKLAVVAVLAIGGLYFATQGGFA